MTEQIDPEELEDGIVTFDDGRMCQIQTWDWIKKTFTVEWSELSEEESDESQSLGDA
jgi:hypothetical protein